MIFKKKAQQTGNCFWGSPNKNGEYKKYNWKVFQKKLANRLFRRTATNLKIYNPEEIINPTGLDRKYDGWAD